MKVMEKMSKNLGLGLSLLLGATLMLVQACADEGKGTKEEEVPYQTVTFSQSPVPEIKGKDGKFNFSALGTNSSGKQIYFGMEQDDCSLGSVGIYDVANKTTQYKNLELGTKDNPDANSPANFSMRLGGPATECDKATIRSIKAGADDAAVMLIDRLGRYLTSLNQNGGVVVMNGDTITAGYRSRPEFFPFGKYGLGPAAATIENNDVSAVGVVKNQWFALFNSTYSPGGYGTFGSAAVAKVGPIGTGAVGTVSGGNFAGITQVVNGVTFDGDKTLYYLSEGKVYSADVSDLAKAKLDFKNVVISDADLPQGLSADQKLQAVRGMAVAGGKLLVGLMAFKVGDKTLGGGVIEVNIADNNEKTRHLEGIPVYGAVASPDRNSALIPTRDGFAYFFGGKLLGPDFSGFTKEKAGQDTPEISGAQPAVFSTVGNDTKIRGVGYSATDKKWYVAVYGSGAYTIDIGEGTKPKKK